jgi:hypothetical protein
MVELAWAMLQRRMAGASDPPQRQALEPDIAYRGSVGTGPAAERTAAASGVPA